MPYLKILIRKEHFKIGDWFYLSDDANPVKLKSQEVINIKLGIKSILPDANYLYKIVEIQDTRLYYNLNQIIIKKI